MNELDRLQSSADFWRNRANAFELALREIVAAHVLDRRELSSIRWEIAKNALDKSINNEVK